MVKHSIKTKIAGLKLQITDEPGPDFLITTGLQKGLIMNHLKKSLVQEGLGFGVPIVRFPTESIFSNLAKVKIVDGRIIKNYNLNCTSQIKMGNKIVKNKVFRLGFESLVKFYMLSESLQITFLKLQQKMANQFNATCIFVDIQSIGKVSVEYQIINDSIIIKSEFNVSKKDPKYIMANEQGADFFDLAKVNKKLLSDKQITGWIRSRNAMFKSKSLGLWFSIKAPTSSEMFLGREHNNYLRWSGINIESKSPKFSYEIKIGGD
jgi:hypothetical protein